MINLTQRGFGNSLSGASSSLPSRYNKKYLRTNKKAGRSALRKI